MTRSADERQRAAALDPTQSFIVEAPAGSGKTELLIQRYLKLLSLVERPEQIIAITFTRKAAAEMRQRVVDTLRAAAANDASIPEHRRQSLQLANAVIAHAAQSGWSLIDQPRRLRIMTIDSLNATLARQMPILSNGTVSLGVTDDTNRLYELAAQRTTESLADTGPLGQSLQCLLRATDNSLVALERLLAGTLPQRDRWLREFAQAGDQTLVERIAANLKRLSDQQLLAVRRLAGSTDEDRLFEVLGRRPADDDAPAAAIGWPAAAGLLLTAAGGWRKRFTRNEGFPADDKALKQTLNEVLEILHAKPGLRDALAELGAVPDATTSPAQQQQLEALELVLPRLLAELKVLFEQNGSVDHTEVAIAAQQALGAVDQPSELLLALDRRIEHILVDEFQDTSHLQWRLLEQLTAGWQAEDGRSLFLVGDPMQSIYRFRDADVSLFLKAGRDGLGGIDLMPIALTENHRSAREIVDWVNRSFTGIFPPGETLDTGVPGFRTALSTRDPEASASVELHLLPDAGYSAEVARVISVVQTTLAHDANQSIGILVRSRSHLAGMRAALTAAGLAAHAIEIDSLTDTQLGQDLIGLTSALLHPADRLGWLGLLRSRWCGLDWADLLALSGDAADSTISERMQSADGLAELSAEGARRTQWLSDRLAEGTRLRPTRTLGRWLRDCWLLIDGPAALLSLRELELAEGYFTALESLARHGDIGDPALLRSYFSMPVAGVDVPTESGLEIMTMHRAKGLEFDTVILPGLGRTTRRSHANLLLSQEFSTSSGDRFSVLGAAAGTTEPLVDFLKSIERRRDADERGRLLYVAATRAKQRLHLIGSVDPDTEAPKAGSLLATLWPALTEPPVIEADVDRHHPSEIALIEVSLQCLTFDGHVPASIATAEAMAATTLDGGAARPDFEWVRPAQVQVGTLIHRELQRLAEQAARGNRAVAPTIDIERFRRELALLGVDASDSLPGAERVADALRNVWNDEVGRWILNPWPEAWSELRLTVREGDRLRHIQLDRSFVDDDGCRWIIDFKSGRHLGSDVARFLDSEVDRYRAQLEGYAEAVAEFDDRPIRVGLYFPLMTAFRDWTPKSSIGAV